MGRKKIELKNIQKNIKINQVVVPMITSEGVEWFPIKYVSEKILLKNFLTSDKIKNYFESFMVDYTFAGTSAQFVRCMNREGWYNLMRDFKTGGYSKEQKEGYNALVNNLGLELPLLNEFEDQDFVPSEQEIKDIVGEYDSYIQECVEYVLEQNGVKEWRICSRCGRKLPLDNTFYKYDVRNDKLLNFCKECSGGAATKKFIIDGNKSKFYYNKNKSLYKNYENHNVIEIYEDWKINGYKGNVPRIINNDNDMWEILKYCFESELIEPKLLTMSYLKKNFEIKFKNTTIQEIYLELFGEGYIYYPWEYGYKNIKGLNFEQCKIIFNNYLNENNIIVENPLQFNYEETIYKSGIRKAVVNTLEFAVEYNDFKYGGYQYKTNSGNYYRNQSNRIFDLKYLIEEHLKIEIDKIPLYLTKMTLQKNGRRLYEVLHSKSYYKNLFEWVNEIYSDKFVEEDFEVTIYRDVFDSQEEMEIDKVLHDNFGNIVYNQRNTEKTINIKGMIPDWILLTEQGCCLVEYFGLYVKKQNNKRILDYIERTEKKMKKYIGLDGYGMLFIFPEDLKNNYIGLNKKLNRFKS